jgi:hypothetical protein
MTPTPPQPPTPPEPPPPTLPPPPRSSRRNLVVALVVVVVVALVVAGAVVALVSSGGDDGGKKREVFAEPISSARNAFTPPTGSDFQNTPPVPTQGISTQPGGQVGLYGGTMNEGSCNKEQLVTFLEQNPDKGRAWATTLGINFTDIRSYIAGLTPVLLRSDTRVTNHGWKNGRVTSFQVVLQAGHAVLVDDKGFPVTKCYCGNPLTPPVAYPPVYYGPRWSSFNKNSLTVIINNPQIIDIFVLVDPRTGQSFTRPRGSDGRQDSPTTPTPTTTPPTTTPPTTSPPTTTPPPTGRQAPAPAQPGLDGTYDFTTTVVAEDPPGICGGASGRLTVTVQGAGSNRQISIVTGGTLSGPLRPDNSFEASGPIPGRDGTETFTGSFTIAGSAVRITGTTTLLLFLTPSGSPDASCTKSVTAQRI